MNGAKGKDRIIRVPLGTVVLKRRYLNSGDSDHVNDDHGDFAIDMERYYEEESLAENRNFHVASTNVQFGDHDGEEDDGEHDSTTRHDYIDEQVIELSTENQCFIAAKGGRGGRGNASNGRMVNLRY